MLPILPVMTCRSGSPGAMPYDAQARGRDARCFAWCLVVAGLVIGSISVSYATYETTTREAVWIQRELSSQNAARLRRMIRDIDEEVRPAGVIVSPWPGVIAGAVVTSFGPLTRDSEAGASARGGIGHFASLM